MSEDVKTILIKKYRFLITRFVIKMGLARYYHQQLIDIMPKALHCHHRLTVTNLLFLILKFHNYWHMQIEKKPYKCLTIIHASIQSANTLAHE